MRPITTLSALLSVVLLLPQVSTRPPQPGGGGGGSFSGGAVAAQILGPTGCATPAFSFSADADAGLCLSAVDNVSLATGQLGFANTVGFNAYSGAASVNFYDAGFLVTALRVQDGIIFLDIDGGTIGAFTTTALSFGSLQLDIGAGSATIPGIVFGTDANTGIWHPGSEQIGFTADGINRVTISSTSGLSLERTITAGGTTGAQTINKMSGTVNFAAAATTLVVTNSLVTTSSIIFCTVRTNDTTATIKNVVPAAGSFTITLTAAATAETSVGFLVTN